MDENAAAGLAAFGVMGTLFVLILAILWVLVPFAIFGIKPLLRDLILCQQKTNELLSRLVIQAKPVDTQAASTLPPTVVVEDTRTLSEIMGSKPDS